MNGAVLSVDLDVLAANIAVARERVAPAEVMVVVKDDAYAHGVEHVVRRAWAEGIRWFGAFDIETARAVRAAAGGDARVFSWLAFGEEDLAAALDLDLDVGVGDPLLLEGLAAAAEASGRTARVHLKIDTGLHRNGVRGEEWPAFVERAAALERAGALEVAGIWSHIAEASDEEDDAARAAFDLAFAQAEEAGLRPRLRHLGASAASFARPEFRYDICRIGAFCYGIRPAGGPSHEELGVRPAAALRANVVRIDDDAVVIGVGALDGLPSSLSGRFDVPTPDGPRRVLGIGPVETRVEPWDARMGDVVVVFGAGAASATDLAELIGTIGEEIVVRVSPTIAREYRAE